MQFIVGWNKNSFEVTLNFVCLSGRIMDDLAIVHDFSIVLPSFCKTLSICGIKFSPLNENDILAYFNFGGAPDGKVNLMEICNFFFFIFYHLLESPH